MGAAPSPLPEPSANTTANASNPFVSSDRPPPQVMAAQGAFTSGPRSIGFKTGGAQARVPCRSVPCPVLA